MSCYLGFEPTDRAGFYFISYNTEDAERISPLVTALSRADVPLWYDYGIEYGDSWAPQINEKLSKSQAVLLFFTKGILQKANSYVKKEYKMAKDFLAKKVYIVMLDEIKPADVPINMLDWWIDITAEQCINAYNLPFDEKLIEQIKKALGIETNEKRMNLLITNYKRLFDEGRNDEAEEYFSEYLSGKSLETKAKMFVNIVSKSMDGIELSSEYGEIWDYKYDKSEAKQKINAEWDELCIGFKRGYGEHFTPRELCVLDVSGKRFVLGNGFVFHRGVYGRGDAHIIQLLRNGEIIHTIGGLIEAADMHMYYDKNESLLYIAYLSDIEEGQGRDFVATTHWSASIISDPTGEAVARDFKFIKERKY